MRYYFMILVALVVTPEYSQRVAPVRGIGTQTCKVLVAASQADKPFEQQAYQWIFGYITGYFRQASDDPTRMISDDTIARSIMEICNKNADKTIDEAITFAISSFPTTEAKKP